MKRIVIPIITASLLLSAVFAVRSFPAIEKEDLFKANVEALSQQEDPGEISMDKFTRFVSYCQYINTGQMIPCLGEIVDCFHPGVLETCTPHPCLKNHY